MSNNSEHIGKKFGSFVVWYERTDRDPTRQKTYIYDGTPEDKERARRDAINLVEDCYFARIDHVEKTITHFWEDGKLV